MIPYPREKDDRPVLFTVLLLLSGLFTGGTCYQTGGESHELRNNLLTPAIEMRADEAKLDDLRTKAMKPGDLEIRIWIEPMMLINAAEGYILEKRDSLWTGKQLLPKQKNPTVVREEHGVVLTPPPSSGKTKDVEPLSGWDFLWRSLTSTGLLTLPDESQLDLRTGKFATEGNIYVVEIKTEKEYRTYRYTAPEQHNLSETKSMLRIVQILHDEFSQDQHE